MASESEICVDELLIKLADIEQMTTKFGQANYNDNGSSRDGLINQAKQLSVGTQTFIDNNRAAIPAYCLKKAADALRKLDSLIGDSQTSKIQFKFKSKSNPAPPTKSSPSEVQGVDAVAISEPEATKQNTFGFRDQCGQQLSLSAQDIDNKDISLVNLKQCNVTIEGLANTVYIRDLDESSVTVILACRAITIASCTSCTFKLACQQLRIDSTYSSSLEIFTSARSMLESSSGLTFRCLDLPQSDIIDKLLLRAKFDRTKNNWNCIDDFDWLSPNAPSTNFRIIN